MSKQTDLINVTDAITVSGSNVGIGTSSPDKAIHVKTAVNNTAVVRIESTATDSYPTLSLKNDAREYQLTAHGPLGDKFTIYDGTAGSHRFVIDSSGNLLVGKTSASTNSVGVEARADGTFAAVKSGGSAAVFATQILVMVKLCSSAEKVQLPNRCCW